MASAVQTTPDTPVTIKVNIDGVARRFKLPLRDVGVNVLETKVCGWLVARASAPKSLPCP
jgi:next-to-BRCA1 protein 1